ncbi:ROK family transcriptional regulator [Sphingomonadaceae bacterium jetA1]|jgi:predicted NBD/HSP70 family sugar kinase|uniref:ROK family transcriptional regulator n=1 Tax=Facivitalis istanbulensis TaxID=3075838 RepID=UPI003480CAE6
MLQTARSLWSLSAADRRLVALMLDAGALSRAELAERIGVTRSAITQMMASLDRFGLVEEEPARKGSRGQPARPMAVRGAAGFSAGVSFSHGYLDAAIIDITGTERAYQHRILPEPTPEAVAKGAADAIAAARIEAGIGTEELLGIGFALPGDFRVDAPLLQAHRYFPAFDGLDARAWFQDRFAERVFVENDGRTCAMGERLAGSGKGCRDFMAVHIGHGVGGGLFLHNRLYRGAHFNAGPLGTFFPLDRPRPSGQDLLETLRANGIDAADFDRLDRVAEDHGDIIAKWCDRAGRQLAPYLHHVANVIDPALIIIGGRLSASLLQDIVKATGLPQHASPERFAGQPPVVIPSTLGARAGAIGAASIPILHLLHPEPA